MAKVNACIWLAFELLFVGAWFIVTANRDLVMSIFDRQIYTSGEEGRGHGHFHRAYRFTRGSIPRWRAFVFAWFFTSCYCFSNLKPLKSVPRSSLLDFHSLSFFCFCFCPLTAPRDHSENCTFNPLSFLTGNSLPGLARTGNSLHGW